MTDLLVCLWLFGSLFTLGFVENLEWRDVFLIVIAWPTILGREIRQSMGCRIDIHTTNAVQVHPGTNARVH